MPFPLKGEVVYLYAFDVADEIVTVKVQEILSKRPFPFEIRPDRTLPKDVPLYKPLAIETAPLAAVGGRPVRVLIRVYDVGVVTIAMRVAFEVDAVLDLVPYHEPALDTGQSLDEVARDLCTRVYKGLQEVMIRSSPPSIPEAYTVFCLTRIAGVEDVNGWFAGQRSAVAGLLNATHPEQLSEEQTGETLRIQRSFENNDLVVIDWDAALVVDLTGYVDDVLYVLELANLQLEEFLMMDARLDRYLNQAYDELERRPMSRFFAPPRTLKALRRFRLDVTKLTDEVTHITKFVGDWYLARVYLGARERFHLEQWRGSVERRLAQIDQLYSIAHAEAYELRMLWLEAVIVIMFAIDLLAIFYKK